MCRANRLCHEKAKMSVWGLHAALLQWLLQEAESALLALAQGKELL